MSASKRPIYLVDGATGKPCEAELEYGIAESHLKDVETSWQASLNALAGQKGAPVQESRHWDWRAKMESFQGLLGFPSFAIRCLGETQGLMIVTTLESCRIPAQKGKPLVYVEYLEAAPWNRAALAGQQRYIGVGSSMVGAAIQLSLDEGFDGRIGLHSLPQADKWYQIKCKMIDCGNDPYKQNLRYFEMTATEAAAFRTASG